VARRARGRRTAATSSTTRGDLSLVNGRIDEVVDDLLALAGVSR